MPLSDHEQKLLAQMEQALYAEDPKFATTLTGRQRGVGSVSRALVGIGSVAVGLTLIIVGISIGQLWLSVIGFVVMFGGVVFAVAAPAPSAAAKTKTGPGKPTRGGPARGSQKSSFVQRMEERWERRADGGGL
ncbi:DUF3040 domain-containing protein [Aquipuribacter sp. MA13-6]|uniref:DUF3040 domain-containing protein n=1 Tax=unclassified Aquipuribacter TaxID=2635084 RepID=UPI003EE87DF6